MVVGRRPFRGRLLLRLNCLIGTRGPTFTAQDKLRILAETHRAVENGAIGAILLREGANSSMLPDCRRLRDAATLGALAPVKRGLKAPATNPQVGELAAARRATARLQQRVDRAEAIVALAPASGLTAGACVALGLSRASVHRHRTRRDRPHPIPAQPTPKPRRALTEEQRELVLALLREPQFVDQARAEIYATLLDEGIYHCSIRTMYRILDANGEIQERRRKLRHPVYQKSELMAERPNEVWSWDITKLTGPARWTCFYLYVIIDIFSRRVVGWRVAVTESAILFKPLFEDTLAKQVDLPGQLTLHADRGASMKAKATTLMLADLGVTKSHSRPHTSNDSPFSESHFKTLKYQPELPKRFGCIEDAKALCRYFFDWYNRDHHHAGLVS